ncbi:hypothetical protein ABID08_002918 [Rhizobium binae]|uniref:Uncharacterized protein n=1 Tax=Rhizobium binae TaxID=1138190 RepID=A0ABV2MJN3_9HYPH|nr:hypothetical protein [Rhizobium binae]MBX4927090.1 hypothetical protein [Rhizobium binae]MBX4970283.1 hypothetical protein [Rhizobium binae]MBX4995300.1 hypothetical protein [Rhizobium binae]QSY85475.1 hypothetical protein J2J99_28215 [Rhizobium binae]
MQVLLTSTSGSTFSFVVTSTFVSSPFMSSVTTNRAGFPDFVLRSSLTEMPFGQVALAKDGRHYWTISIQNSVPQPYLKPASFNWSSGFHREGGLT